MSSRYFLLFFTLLVAAVSCAETEPVPLFQEGYLTGAEDADIYYRVIGSGLDTLVVIHGGHGAGMISILPSVRPWERIIF